MSTPRAIIISGPSGSGKSTLARNLTASLPIGSFLICSADDYFNRRGNGVYDFDKNLLPDAHKECYLNFITGVNARVPLIIVDNTNLEGRDIAPYYRYAEVMGYDVSIVKLTVDPKLGASRNLHNVPLKAIESMSKRHGIGWAPYWKVTVQ